MDRVLLGPKEAILLNALEAREQEVDICIFVDSDHEGDKKSSTSRSGFTMYINVPWDSGIQTNSLLIHQYSELSSWE